MNRKKLTFSIGLTDVFGGAAVLAVPAFAMHHELAVDILMGTGSPFSSFGRGGIR